ncbi:MAG TPA: LysM peptidoglycan-binding domain-containing protein [Chloroflexota bacterium]|jgi:LysM repeat protein|nr:LysM peptidoglycan-binding domain-containing protein [Chloroflexota bacterium]
MPRPLLVDLLVVLLALVVGYAGTSVVARHVLSFVTTPVVQSASSPTATVAPAVTFTPAPSPLPVTPSVPSATTTSAVASPTIALTSTSTPAVVIYVVQSGDTVDSIARKFGVTIDAIARANQLSDPNQLSLGQRLRIPPK